MAVMQRPLVKDGLSALMQTPEHTVVMPLHPHAGRSYQCSEATRASYMSIAFTASLKHL